MRIAPAETMPPPAIPAAELALTPALSAIVPAEFFRPNGSDAVIAAIKEEVRKQAAQLDISTESRRAAIASLAYKVAKSKTFLDAQRKNLVADQKETLKVIDKEGARIWDELEALQAEVRKPLTDWENAEKTRIGNHEAALKLIQEATTTPWTSAAEVDARIAYVNQLIDRPWEEFHSRADLLSRNVIAHLMQAWDEAKQREAEAAELARLRAEEIERKERERVQAIADEAAAKERRLAEQRAEEVRVAAERERQRIEDERFQAEARARQAEAARIAAEERSARDAAEAERRAEVAKAEAESARIAAAQLAERRAQEAAEKAARDREAAVEDERQRIAEQQRKEREEQEKRERNKKHRANIEFLAVAALAEFLDQDLEPDTAAKHIIAAISAGKIPNVTINY